MNSSGCFVMGEALSLSMRRILVALVMLCLWQTSVGRAQERQHDSIVAIVDGTPITARQLESAITMTLLSEGGTDDDTQRRQARARVLNQLILDVLKEQEGARQRLHPTQSSIEEALRNIERQNGVAEGGFREFMSDKGMPVESVLSRIRADLYWDNLVRYKLARDVFISEQDVDDELERFEYLRDKHNYALHELFLPHEGRDHNEAYQRMRRLRAEMLSTPQIFGNFVNGVIRHSNLPSGSVGGHLGWTLIESLPHEARYQIAQLKIGEISEPIVTTDGVHLYYLRDKRMFSEETKRTISLRRFVVNEQERMLDDDEYAEAVAVLQKLLLTDRFCDKKASEVTSFFTEEAVPLMVEDFGSFNEGDIVQGLQGILLQTMTGEVTPALRDDDGTFFIQVCQRGVNYVEFPSREFIRNGLFQQRLQQLADRYSQDLWSSAYIDIKDESLGL